MIKVSIIVTYCILIKSVIVSAEISFADALPRIISQSRELLVIEVIRTKVDTGDISVPWRIQSVNKNDNSLYNGLTGELEFLSGEVLKTIEITMPSEPQEYEEENLEVILDRPKGGARLKVCYILYVRSSANIRHKIVSLMTHNSADERELI